MCINNLKKIFSKSFEYDHKTGQHRTDIRMFVIIFTIVDTVR